MELLSNLLLIICLALPFLLTYVNHKFCHEKFGNVSLCLVACIGCWLLIQGSVQLVEWDLQNHLDSFDLDHNGFFSGDELTPEQAQAMYRVTNDTGRALAPFTGAILSIGYNGLMFGVMSLVGYINSKNDK